MDFKSYKFNFGITLFLVLLSVPTLFNIAQWTETTYFPVTKDFRITNVDILTPGYPVIEGSVRRDRQCELKNVVFMDVSNGYHKPIGIERPDLIDPKRPAGDYTFGPWIMFTDINTLKNHTYLETTHTCHPFYDTVTIIPMSEVFSNGEE